jgi:hypothetical protein
MTCDWPLLHLVGFCLAEVSSGWLLVGMPVGVERYVSHVVGISRFGTL